MSHPSSVTIVNAGYRSTNFWVISAGRARLLVDLGWPGMVGTLRANLKRLGIPLAELRGGLATHYHIDHAGAAEDLKRLGMPLLVLAEQAAALPQMKRWAKPQDNYTEITLEGNVTLTCAASRAWLHTHLGLAGEIVSTPGHSEDSVSLVLDEGAVFTGDLPPLPLEGQPSAEAARASWRRLRALGATRIYPGHGPARPMYAEAELAG